MFHNSGDDLKTHGPGLHEKFKQALNENFHIERELKSLSRVSSDKVQLTAVQVNELRDALRQTEDGDLTVPSRYLGQGHPLKKKKFGSKMLDGVYYNKRSPLHPCLTKAQFQNMLSYGDGIAAIGWKQ